MAKPQISVCMIVKNEQEMLPRALDSARELADELIIVDTGSTDRTVEIAESYGAKVFHHEWEYNFAKHRNQSINYATGEWIFILDADEELSEDAIPKLRDAVAGEQAEVIVIPVRSASLETSGGQQSVHNSIRLFKRSTGLRYEGAVHNEIRFNGKSQFVPAVLLHYGYHLSREKMVAKFQRTTDLLQREMEQEPQNPKWPHYLAVSLFTESLFTEARELAERSIQLCDGDRERERIWLDNFYIAAACHLENKNTEEAETLIARALEIMPDYIDGWAIRTSIHFIRRQSALLQQAADRYRELVQKHERQPSAFGTTPFHALHHMPDITLRLAIDAYRRGDMERYEESLKEAKLLSPDPGDIACAAARFFIGTDNPEEAVAVLTAAHQQEPAHEQVLNTLIPLLVRVGQLQDARRRLAISREAGFGEEKAGFLDGLMEMLAGHWEQAEENYVLLLDQFPDNVEARINLAVVKEKLGDDVGAEKLYHEAIDRNPEKLDSAINLAHLYMRTDRQADATAFFERICQIDASLHDVRLTLASLYLDTGDADRLLFHGVRLAELLGVMPATPIDNVPALGALFYTTAKQLATLQLHKAASLANGLAARLQPDDSRLQVAYGWSLLKTGEFQNAINAFENAVRLSPEDWEAFEGMGQGYMALGATDAARMCEEKVATLKRH